MAFVITLHKFWTDHQFDPQLFEAECKKWISLLLKLVDITGDNPQVHFEIFHGKSLHTNAMKKYRVDIIKHVSWGRRLDSFRLLDITCNVSSLSHFQVIQLTRINFSQLTVQQFFSLYKAFHIWPNKVRRVRECLIHDTIVVFF